MIYFIVQIFCICLHKADNIMPFVAKVGDVANGPLVIKNDVLLKLRTPTSLLLSIRT